MSVPVSQLSRFLGVRQWGKLGRTGTIPNKAIRWLSIQRHFPVLINRSVVTSQHVSPQFHCQRQLHSLDLLPTPKGCPTPTMVVKLDSPEFEAIKTPELLELASLFKKYDYQICIAGGAVRDLLLGLAPSDVDFATTATPEQMHDMFNKEGIRILNKAGEKHGTVAVRINDKENFEITTLRVDKNCDGRHADVEFTTNWQEDASRRDLTINSMFCHLDGAIWDYFDGIEHLKQRRVVFVGDARARIQEDYLRILRYFRFWGRFTNEDQTETINEVDAATMLAVKENVDGLASISGERIWTELKKIANGRFADENEQSLQREGDISEAISRMLSSGMAKQLALPDTADADLYRRIWNRARKHQPEPMTMLSCLFQSESDVATFHARMKLANVERDLGFFIVRNRGGVDDSAMPAKKYYELLVLDQVFNRIPNGAEQVCELVKYEGRADELLADLQTYIATAPVFPVNGLMIAQSEKVPKGPAVRVALQRLFDVWKQSDCQSAADELLKLLDTDETLKSNLEACLEAENQKRLASKKRKRQNSNETAAS